MMRFIFDLPFDFMFDLLELILNHITDMFEFVIDSFIENFR